MWEVLIPVVTGFIVWFFQTRIEHLRRAQERLQDERRKVYLETLEPIIRTLAGIKDPRELAKAQKQIISFDYRRTGVEFNLIGSDKVVDAFNNYMQHIFQTDGKSSTEAAAEMLRLYGQLLLEIRKHVGEPRTKLTPADMLKSQIADIDTVLKP